VPDLRQIAGFLMLVLVGCSSGTAVREEQTETGKRVLAKAAEAQKKAAENEPRVNPSPTVESEASVLPSVSSADTAQQPPPDTLLTETPPEDGEDAITRKMEEARTHYLAALEAQESGDTTSSGLEFERALGIINELSEFPEIDQNKDFTELSESIVEDYEKHIAVIGELTPYASLFALREKLSQVVEEIDTTIAGIPRHEIKGTQIPLGFNEYVERNITFFMGKGREYFERWMYLEGRYFPLMKKIFREEGVPEELAYLAMPESGLRTDARSWVGAVGLWQFMKGTGALYGLRTTWWYDERRDFEKSTRAAARHLKDLYEEFGDWYHVLGAYNAGPGRIFRAMRRSGSTDFWTFRPHLPRQTRNYIPQFVAVTRMAMQPHLYGFAGAERAEPIQYDVVTIDDCVDLAILASCALTDVTVMKELNPELLHWCTPPGVLGYRLRIPSGRRDTFLVRYSRIPEDQKRDWTMHTVRRGETLSTIALRYGLTVGLLQDVNKIRNSRVLSIGQKLAIPLPRIVAASAKIPFEYDRTTKGVSFGAAKRYAERAERTSSARAREPRQPKGKAKLDYTVKRGDTIGHIAEWYGVRASDIRNWNGVSYGKAIYPGERLAIWVDPSEIGKYRPIENLSFAEKQARLTEVPKDVAEARAATQRKVTGTGEWIQHTVRSGETLDGISREYGVTVVDLRSWNDLRSNSIRPGQVIEVFERPDERVQLIGPRPQSQSLASLNPLTSPADRDQTRIHMVKRGDTLFEISRKFGVSIEDIKTANSLRSNALSVGQTLRIPGRSSSSNIRVHKVRSGETLWALSRIYGISVAELESANNLANGLHPGDEIVIPSR